VSILRELLRGVRLDPRSVVGAPLHKVQAELRRVPVCIDITDLPTELLEPPVGEEQAMAPFPLCWVEGGTRALSTPARFACLVEWQGLAEATAHRAELIARAGGQMLYSKLRASDDNTTFRSLEGDTLGMVGALHLRCYTAIGDGRLVGIMGDCWVPMREGGNMFTGYDGGTLKVCSLHRAVRDLSHDEHATMNNIAVMAVRVVGLFALLNCRNVGLADSAPHQHRRKGHRQGRTGISWKVLHLHPATGPKAAREGSHRLGDQLTRAHLVRGHFRTYTEAAPLLGHTVGRIFFHAHVRGNAERGAVLKDYSVEA
jgi:hypothetical protein